MPTNHYFELFNQTSNDTRLYDDLINESVQMHGVDAYYIPRVSISNFDMLFGDDPTKNFTTAYPMEMYVQSVDQFEGAELFSKFGLEVKKQARFLVTKRSFKKNIPSTLIRPLEGDLLWLSNFKALFEIKFSNNEYFFYTFGKNNTYGWSLVCEKFIYSQEPISTGITAIDDAVSTVIATYNFQMFTQNLADVDGGDFLSTHSGVVDGSDFSQTNYSGVIDGGDYSINHYPMIGTYQPGELVFQTDTNASTGNVVASGTVEGWNLPTGVLSLSTLKGEFADNKIVFGSNSSAQWALDYYDDLTDINNQLNNNDLVEDESNTVLDFTETNPFGQPISSDQL